MIFYIIEVPYIKFYMNKNFISLLFQNMRGVYFKILTAVVAMNYLYALVVGRF